MPEFVKNVGKACLLSLSLWLSVGPLALMQIGAWGWMIASYSQESTVEQAVRETFSGERPCAMCRAIGTIKEAKQSKEPEPFQPERKSLHLMLGLERAIIVSTPRSEDATWPPFHRLYTLDISEVPTPPPRSFA